MSASPKRKFLNTPSVDKTGESASSEPLLQGDRLSDPAISGAGETVKSIKDFLHENSSNRRRDQKCNACGSSLGYLDAYCWLDGADVASVIQLPFCPKCNPDVLTALRRRRAASGSDTSVA